MLFANNPFSVRPLNLDDARPFTASSVADYVACLSTLDGTLRSIPADGFHWSFILVGVRGSQLEALKLVM